MIKEIYYLKIMWWQKSVPSHFLLYKWTIANAGEFISVLR